MLYLDYSREHGEWIPNVDGGNHNYEAISLLKWLNQEVYAQFPKAITIAEESTSFHGVSRPVDLGGLGFGFKWNMGWMNDSLRYLAEDPVNRQYHHNLLTFAMMYTYSENYLLPISHDEVVHGKGSLIGKIPGHQDEQLATLRAYLAYMWAHPGKQLLFMGCEFAQTREWADGRSLDWHLLDHAAHYRVHNLVKELNEVYKAHPALWALDHDPAGFDWLDADDNGGNTLSFVRYGSRDRREDAVVVAVNFGGSDRGGIRLGVPSRGRWRVAVDTHGFDPYGSPSQGGVVLEAEDVPWQGQPFSVTVHLSRLSAVYLVRDAEETPAAAPVSEVAAPVQPGRPDSADPTTGSGMRPGA